MSEEQASVNTAAETSTTTTAPAATSDKPTIKLYWLDKSRSQRILWLLEELSLPYELAIFHRDAKTKLAPPELKEIHALGKSPVISIQSASACAGAGGKEEDNNNNNNNKPIVLAESGLITEYLVEHFGAGTKLLPTRWRAGAEGKVGGETEAYMRYRYFLHYVEGSLMPLMVMSLVAGNIKSSPVPFFIKPITGKIAGSLNDGYLAPNFAAHFAFLEAQLASSGGDYLCGADLSGADILMSFPLIAGRSRGAFSGASHPRLAAYTERLEAADGYKRAVAKIVELDGGFDPSL